MFLRRRRLIAASGLAVASSALPRLAIGQADRRPSITIAVQQIANSASLEARARAVQRRLARFSFIFENADRRTSGPARADARAWPRAGSASTNAPSSWRCARA